MAWTTFANLTAPTLPELDGNFSVLSYLINITCTVSGTNALTLTSQAGASTYTQYQAGMRLQGVATATNSAAVTAQLGTLALLPVYKDSPAGPVLLSGGEIVQLTAFTLLYDQALNASAGGWHLQNSSGALSGYSLGSLNIGLLGAASLTAGAFALSSISFGSLSATTGSITNLVSSLATFGTVALGTGAPLLRMNSTLASAVFTTLTPGLAQYVTVPWSGVQPFDNVFLGWSLAPTASIVFSAWSPASGSVVVQAFNPLAAATVTVNTVNFRLTNLGWT